MADDTAPDWAAIRHCYEETDTRAAEICARFAITRGELEAIRKRQTWIRKFPRPFPGSKQPALPPTPPTAAATVPPRPSAAADAQSLPPPPRARHPRRAAPKRKPASKTGRTPAATSSPRSLASLHDRATGSLQGREGGEPAQPGQPAHTISPLTASVRRALVARLVAAISLKLEQLERRMAMDLAAIDAGAADASAATDHERETRAIGALIDNLGKVTELDHDLDRPAAGNVAGTAGKHFAANDLAGHAAANSLADEADRARGALAERLHKIVDAATGRS